MGPCPWCGPWGGMSWGWGNWWWGLFTMLFWLLVLFGFLLLVFWTVRQILREGRSGGGSTRAIEIVQERYARGEITREQYEQMRRDILGGSGG
ncbi:MAG: SHOCT domain-containing protein [Thermomicrobium sp.]|nr:SHOCT domain-containing protein [Thermomicrobium sp.]MDW7981496.1 SHOCT domain-containing protein [Thermomicrobium sp.]